MDSIIAYQVAIKALRRAVNGGVFITNITPQDEGDVYNKEFSDRGNTLVSCVSNTFKVRVHVTAAVGHTHYIPIVTVKGNEVNFISTNEGGMSAGYVDIDTEGDELINIQHEDGAEYSVNIFYQDPPEIELLEFVGDYPHSYGVQQTELKENDTFQLRVKTNRDFTQVIVSNYGACKYSSHNVATGNDATITVTIADRGVSPQELQAKVRVVDNNGVRSSDVLTPNTVLVNNRHPYIGSSSIQYPPLQEALKDNENATVSTSVNDFDIISYTSSQLSIDEPDVYVQDKEVTRTSGNYNISSNNLHIQAIRLANGAATSRSTCVFIAHADPVATISKATRFRSGGNDGTSPQTHIVTVNSNQQLMFEPTLNLGGPGVWTAGFRGGAATWRRNIRIHDNDARGTFNFTGFSATNLANKTINNITGDNTYTIGGFVPRSISIPPYTDHCIINVPIADYNKVSISWSIKPLPNRRPIGTTATPDPDSWAANRVGSPVTIRILDSTAVERMGDIPSTITVQEAL